MDLSNDFLYFKKTLDDNNIELFDYELRIAHKRFLTLFKLPSQTGGSQNETVDLNILNVLDKMSHTHLSHLVNSLLTNNVNKSKWIFNMY